jgi:hypothetical protein
MARLAERSAADVGWGVACGADLAVSAVAERALADARALLAAAGGAPLALPELFAVGQFVRCVVVEAPQADQGGAKAKAGRSSKHLELSLLLRDVQVRAAGPAARGSLELGNGMHTPLGRVRR